MTDQITTEKLIEEMTKAIWMHYNPIISQHKIKAAIRRLNELGFAIVPKEPTKAMEEAWINARRTWQPSGMMPASTKVYEWHRFGFTYTAMINEGEIRL